jgi:hypothetical protein
MPFTLSHAAVVLPFSRPLARWRLLSAALIGSMIPDSRYFLPWRTQHFETHSASSLATYSLPAGLLVYWLFQYLVKVPMIEMLPDGAYARWLPFEAPASIRKLRQWLLAAGGIFVGAFTHLVWDTFTHEGSRGVRMLPVLDEPIFGVGRHHLLFSRVLQDLSSLLGVMVVIIMIAYGLRRGSTPPILKRRLSTSERRVWTWSLLLVTLLLFAGFVIIGRWLDAYPFGITSIMNDTAIASLRALATAVIIFALALQLRLRTPRTHADYLSSGPGR